MVVRKVVEQNPLAPKTYTVGKDGAPITDQFYDCINDITDHSQPLQYYLPQEADLSRTCPPE